MFISRKIRNVEFFISYTNFPGVLKGIENDIGLDHRSYDPLHSKQKILFINTKLSQTKLLSKFCNKKSEQIFTHLRKGIFL